MNDKIKIALTGTALFVSGVTALIWIKAMTGSKIISIAKTFVGQKEIAPNRGFVSAHFENLMRKFGQWWSGAEWCAAFVRMVWLLALNGKQREVAKKLLSASSQQTYVNFANDTSGLFEVSQQPKIGSIAIWQRTTNPAKGHAGIYLGKVNGKHQFIEGNRNNMVALMYYDDYTRISNILVLRGFIHWK